MKNLFKKSWFLGTIILGVMLVVFFINLWIMSLNLLSPYTGDNFWTLAADINQGYFMNIFSFILMILFYVSILPILLSGFSFLRKKSWGMVVAILYFLAFDVTFITFHILNYYLSLFALILTIINLVLIAGLFVLMIIRKKVLDEDIDQEQSEAAIKLNESRLPLYVLLISIASVVVFLTTFFVPVYSLGESGNITYITIINVLLFGETGLESIIFFLVDFFAFLGVMLYFAQGLTFYFFDKERFINQSKTLVNAVFTITLIFFMTGLTIDMIHTIGGDTAQTISYIPMLLMLIVMFSFSVLRGKYSSYYKILYKESGVRYAKIEPLFYVVILTAITVLMLLLPLVKLGITFGAYNYTVRLTGFNILRDYASLDPGYRIIAYVLVVMLIASGLTLVTTISGYLSKYKQFNSLVKLAAIVNVFMVFIVAISGYYFQIAKQINQTVIQDIFNFYGINIPGGFDMTYTVGTDGVYALIASTAILILMFVRKAFEREDLSVSLTDGLSLGGAAASGKDASTGQIEEEYQPFDPCPGFTELDQRVEEFAENLENRKKLKTENTTLNELVNFIVDYARNSRLHLSYTPEDIATFVAGLGASKLSILQGMSGTGKTSLPKIFSEAVFGNCEIIEVESSWKDKNELLGYYNEFSMKYTPKKFTLALYKAALNQEIFTFILLDEMNLSRIEYYFSDFLSLMENEEGHREIKLINLKLSRKEEDEDVEYTALDYGHTLKVPSNVWFIGTANRDESTFVISDKVYDRAHTMNFTKRAPKVRNYSSPMSQQYYDYETVNKLFTEAKANGDFDAEGSDLIKRVEVLLAPFNISFGNRILNQIEDFVNIYKACFENENVESEAIEKILLSKVVAKLEVKTIDDKEKLEMEFEKLNLKQCADFIKSLDNE